MYVEHEYERGGALAYLAAWDVCSPRQDLRAVRKDHWHRAVRRTGPRRDAPRTVPLGGACLLGHGQRILTPRVDLHHATPAGMAHHHPCPHPGSCQLAEAG